MCLRPAEGAVERVTGAAGGLRDQVTVQVNGGRDRLMAEPAGNFRDRDAFGKCRAGECMPQVVEGSVGGQSDRRDRGLPDLSVVVVAPQQGSPRGAAQQVAVTETELFDMIDHDVLAVTGVDTLELVSRLQRSDLDQATLDGLRIMADRLCSEYPFMPSDQLLVEGRSWLRRVVSFQGQRLTLNQHREILTLAGWIALLIACVEYDSGDRQAAETTRQAALSLGTEADHAEVKAWAHEIRAWIDLTTGNYHGVVAAARTGIEAAPGHSVAIQLAAHEAKAWARIGDRRATEVALDKGRRLLEAMPYPGLSSQSRQRLS
jgi:hypothetical protein